MRTVKINKVRLQVEEYLKTAGPMVKANSNSQSLKPTFTVKTSFINNEVLTNIDAFVYIEGINAPVRKNVTIVSLIEKGKTNIDAIIQKVDRFISEIPAAVNEKLSDN